MRTTQILLLLLGASYATTLRAQAPLQDVELLARAYGTTPPPGYFEIKATEVLPTDRRGGWARRVPGLSSSTSGAAPAPARVGSAVGTFTVPLVLGLFGDSQLNPPFSREEIQTEFFDGPNSRYKTIPEFYAELSGGRVELVGETFEWVQSTLPVREVTAGQSGLTRSGMVGEFIKELLAMHDDGSVDWGLYDNDGPDGIPNSGDDDGFVDILAVMHPTHGAECGGSGQGDRIWSHKWSLISATNAPYVSSTPAAGGGFIRFDQYNIQPVFACPSVSNLPPTEINEIGVVAHEIGHAFGLPDLYATQGSHHGIGRWGLMGSGSWGCRASPLQPETPCHMSAWSKAVLGWVDVETLAPDEDFGIVTLEPVVSRGTVLRIDAQDGSGDYFLLENRQRIGFDAGMPEQGAFAGLAETGLLIWRIDEEQVNRFWTSNLVNADPDRMGVWLRQADGENDLGASRGGNKADSGDPYPGFTGNVAFHTATYPASDSHTGASSGLTVLGIDEVGEDVAFRLVTRFPEVRVSTTGDSGEGGLLSIDGVAVPGTVALQRVAPFDAVTVEAAGGEPIAEGMRVGFTGWSDGADIGRVRDVPVGLDDVHLVAEYGRREVLLSVDLLGGQEGIAPGRITSDVPSDDLWFEEGVVAELTAEPITGFEFREWGGVLEGQGNPATLLIDRPLSATATFDQTYGVEEEVRHPMVATASHSIQLLAENGTEPISWTRTAGALPEGVTLASDGLIEGRPLDLGEFRLSLRAVDASGLVAEGELVLDVQAPRFGISQIVGPFLLNPGTLITVEREFLDRFGNGNGLYDVGDLRAFLLAYPDLPQTEDEAALVERFLSVTRFQPRPGGGR